MMRIAVVRHVFDLEGGQDCSILDDNSWNRVFVKYESTFAFSDKFDDMLAWCKDNLGEDRKDWDYGEAIIYNEINHWFEPKMFAFVFKDKEAAMIFKLMWG
jgi:hypothetical protein